MAAEKITQRELAKRLGITTRQVRALNDRGIPREESGRRRYLWPLAKEWYVEFKIEERRRRSGAGADAPKSFNEARTEKTIAQARLEWLKVAEKEGRLAPTEVINEILGVVCERIRQRLMSVPDRWALQLVGLEDEDEARAVLEPAVTEILEDLAGIGTELTPGTFMSSNGTGSRS